MLEVCFKKKVVYLFFCLFICCSCSNKSIDSNEPIKEKEDVFVDSRVNVILDTDTYNECDDQFALSYLLANQDLFNINLITVAPFSHPEKVNVVEGLPLSYNEILKISDLALFDYRDKVFIGSSDYLSNGYSEVSPAVENIINTVMKNDKTYVLATGAITNVALAIKNEPRIVDKMEVIWLGGNSLSSVNNYEYNFSQDVDAVRYVLESNVKFTIIPCQGVVSNLEMNINDLKKNYNQGRFSNYLIDVFSKGDYFSNPDTRVIWDISVVAYLVNPKWFDVEDVYISGIDDNMAYTYGENGHHVFVATGLKKDEIFNDLYT